MELAKKGPWRRMMKIIISLITLMIFLVIACAEADNDKQGKDARRSVSNSASSSAATYSVQELEDMGWTVQDGWAFKPFEPEDGLGLNSPVFGPGTIQQCQNILGTTSQEEYTCFYSCQDFSHHAIKLCLAAGIKAWRFDFHCESNVEENGVCRKVTKGHAIIVMEMRGEDGKLYWCPQEPQAPLPDGMMSNLGDLCIKKGGSWPPGFLTDLCHGYKMGELGTHSEMHKLCDNPKGDMSDPTKACTAEPRDSPDRWS